LYEERVTATDFVQLTWEEFDYYAKNIASDIKSFCEKSNIIIDFICPIIRGGSILAVYLSHLLGIIPCMGIQFKHLNISDLYETPKLLWNSFTYISEVKRSEKEYTVLLVEGNHCSGGTALEAIRVLKQYFPKIKIIYASLARDYDNKEAVSEAIISANGYYSNESQKDLNLETIEKYKIREKFSVFPWELVQEEMDECNLVKVNIKTNLID